MIKFPELEEKILKFWQEKNIFKKTLTKQAPKGHFTFYEGPPTANGKPGIHHVLARAFKDLIPRYKTMQGYLVERKAGWDTHGLPVELEVEKKIQAAELKESKIDWQEKGEGMKEETYLKSKVKLKTTKDIIEEYGIEKFNDECKKSVWRYKEDWEKLTERIGFWLDMANPYITYHKEYIETLWWIFKQVYEKNLLYQGHKVVPQCPRCGTALSSHEVAQGYQAITEPSVFIKFKVTKGNETVKTGDYILSWTTTPWTLPGNVALAVGEDFNYLRIAIGQDYYIMAKDCLDVIEDDYEIIYKFKGQEMLEVEYQPLFPGALPSEVENYSKAFKVYSADFVTTKEGTGVVHTAVMYGEDDYQLGLQVGLPKHHTVDENGRFQFSMINDQYPKEVVDLYKKINNQFVKDKDVEQAIVDNLKKRDLLYKTIDYTHDYPFCWRCDTPLLYYAKDSWFFKMSELREQLIKENQKINWLPAHLKDGRFGEWLSQVKDWAISRERYWGTPLPIWKCEACGEIKVIGSYQELQQETGCPLILQKDFDPHRPFIDQYKLNCHCGGEMWRIKEVADCWFDSGSMPLAQYHYPFENKEKIEDKNYYPADFIAEAIDQTRGWFYTLLAVGVLVGRGTSYKNVICLGHINDEKGQKMSKHLGNVIDPWSVINQWGADALRFHLYTINQPGESKNFDIKNVESVVRKNFIILFNVLSFFIMYSRDNQVLSATPKSKNILDEWIIARLNQLIDKVTNALDKYDIFTAGRSLTDFINDLSTWYLRRSRERFKGEDLKDKKAAVDSLGYCLITLSKLLAPFTPFIAEELYQQLHGSKESVHLEEWPKAKRFDQALIKEMEQIRKIVELALAKRDEAGIKVRQPLNQLTVISGKIAHGLVKLIKDEVNVKEVVFKKGEALMVTLDTEITEELKVEGLYRELVRSINQLRKERGLNINDYVRLYYYSESNFVNEVIEKNKDKLLKNTISKDSERLNLMKIKNQFRNTGKEVLLNGEKIWLEIRPW